MNLGIERCLFIFIFHFYFFLGGRVYVCFFLDRGNKCDSRFFFWIGKHEYIWIGETYLRKPTRLGEVSPCEGSENLEGVWGRNGAPK